MMLLRKRPGAQRNGKPIRHTSPKNPSSSQFYARKRALKRQHINNRKMQVLEYTVLIAGA